MSVVGQTTESGVVVTATTVLGSKTLQFPDGSLYVANFLGDGSTVVVTDTRSDAAKAANPNP